MTIIAPVPQRIPPTQLSSWLRCPGCRTYLAHYCTPSPITNCQARIFRPDWSVDAPADFASATLPVLVTLRHRQNPNSSRSLTSESEVTLPPSPTPTSHNVANAALFRLRLQRETIAVGFVRAGSPGGTSKSTQYALPHSSPGQEEMESNKGQTTRWTVTCFECLQITNFLVAYRYDSSTAHASMVVV